MENIKFIYETLIHYMDKDIYPFHMPGHKRNLDFLSFSVEPALIDVTEFGSMDNLHNPIGIISNCQKKAAEIFSADFSYLLTNGSTGGIIAAILSCCGDDDDIIVARNSHKSVFSGVILSGATPHYVYPAITKYGIAGGISPADVALAFEYNPSAKAVVITSPTYEGFVSDIKTISEIAHIHNAILIVDEAHGAHFNFSNAFPPSSITLGADIVIQSLHKTLPSLTQTSILHTKGSRVSHFMLKNGLAMVNSSSPSYVLMASIDKCINSLGENSVSMFNKYVPNLLLLRNRLKLLKNIELLDKEFIQDSYISHIDLSKLVFVTKKQITNHDLDDILINRYALQVESSNENHIIAMTSVADTLAGFERLKTAMFSIDSLLNNRDDKQFLQVNQYPKAEYCMHPRKALHLPKKEMPINKAAGRISADFFTPYPPGIPLLLPGELINDTITNYAGSKYASTIINVLGYNN